jgi:hypothetical protein
MIEPGLREQGSWRHQRYPGLQSEAFRRAAPRPVLDLPHETGCDGSAFHHHASPEKRRASIEWRDSHRHGLDSRAGTFPMGIPYPVDQGVEPAGSPGANHQVPRVGQQAEGQKANTVCFELGRQILEHQAVVARALQARAARQQASGDVEVAAAIGRVWHLGAPWCRNTSKRDATVAEGGLRPGMELR